MAIFDITLRLGSTTQTESCSQRAAVPALTNQDPIELSSSLPSPIFLVQSGSTVSSHPQTQSYSPIDKAAKCCSPTEEELTTAFEDENSLYYDCETSSTISSSFMMDEQDSDSLVKDHARSTGSLVFDHLKILLSQLDIPDNDSPKYHVAWAFDGRFAKPKPSAAFDSIAFEFKQMEYDSTMRGEDLNNKSDLLQIQRKSKFLVKLPSIEFNQVPKFVKNLSKTPSWAVLKPLGPTTSVTFATATALLS
ncbi:hypothetical protein CROQUDRAFT_387910 [Cronartium quercuum f. sp. fusiforme G11]|uniref:Uncharacterized protein n=1 Tax=Cronartium quercuum f. sp. fusiforme G11 TaxID=708437 RepID=A0A9P6NMP9_9BASI|nr:hypothetical protein CROQUDRAFT_387910 [Cronartium quercuum f. sp. fusiforme G11]